MREDGADSAKLNGDQPMSENNEPLTVTVPEYCEATGFGQSTVYAAIARGELPVVRAGRAVRLPRWLLDRLKKGGE